MKKSFYFLMFIGLAFTSCEPVEDLHEQVRADLDARPNFGNVEFTLSEEDYTELGLNFGNFNSVDHANELIPGYLSDLYPVLGQGSIATVTVDIYNPTLITVDDVTEYVVTDEDYEALGFRYGNFDSSDDMVRLLEYQFPDAQEGDAVELTYEYYAGSTSTRTTTHVFTGESWIQVMTLDREDYTEMGERFPNFSSRDDAREDLANFLRLRMPYAQAGATQAVMYDLHIGGGDTVKNVEFFSYDGNTWSAAEDVVQETLQFGHTGSEWEPDNTIMYTLRPADYEAIGEALADEEGYADPAWSVGNYNNFDRREGNRNYWDMDMLVEAMNVVLDRIHPDAEEGQKYVVTFDIYDGSAGTETLSLIKEGGEWVLNQ